MKRLFINLFSLMILRQHRMLDTENVWYLIAPNTAIYSVTPQITPIIPEANVKKSTAKA